MLLSTPTSPRLKVTRSQGCGSREWDQCPYKRPESWLAVPV